MGSDVVCKYCGSANTRKYGFVEGVQTYFCNNCRRKFKADDRLFRMKTPAKNVSAALGMYYDGMSIGAICRNLATPEGGQPSTKTVYEWINKYTNEVTDRFKDYHPKVGDTWIADETVLRIDGANVWLYDIIDEKTRFMLASRVAIARTTENAKQLMLAAAKCAGKTPKVVITDQNNSYLDGVEMAFGRDTEHKLGGPFRIEKEGNTNLIERFHGTLKARTKTMRGLKSIDTAIQFADGYLAFYNYLRPHETLDGKTPAEAAGIDYPCRTWETVILHAEPQVEVLQVPAQTIVVSEQEPYVRPIRHRHYPAQRPRLRKRKPASQVTVSIMRTGRRRR